MTSKSTTISCTVASTELIELFDQNRLGNLTADLTAHLSTCSKCQREYKELVTLNETFGTEKVLNPGDIFWTNFLPKLRWRMERESGPSRRLDHSLIPSLGLTILMLLVLLKSPIPIAPPSWYSTITQEDATATVSQIWNTQFNQYSIDNSQESSTNWNDYVSDSDLNIIEELSSPTKYTSNDPVDELLKLSDEQLEELFQKLKEKPIIKSS